MLYLTCPTCHYFLGQKILKYESDKDKICSNPNLSQEDRDNELSKLHKSLKLKRYCCKMRIMTYKDYVHDILPVKTED